MTKPEKIKLLADTLAWVNTVRTEQGLEPLTALRRGRRKCMFECPLARSLADRGEVFVMLLCVTGIGVGAKMLPWAVRTFVFRFDSGEFPEFDEAVG